MQIGISSWTYSWACGIPGYDQPARPLDVMTLLQRAHDLGADCVQIADNLPVCGMETSRLMEVKRMAEDYGLRIELGVAGSRLDILQKALETAQLLGASLVRTLLHTPGDIPTFDEARQRLEAVVPAYSQAGVTLAVENHDLYSSSWLRRLVEAVHSPFVGICLDAVNNLAQGESFREVLECLAPYTVNFHCKDFAIRRKPSMLGFDVTGAPAGEGMIHYELAAAYLAGKEISWVLELWTPDQGDLRKTLALEEEWAEKSMAFLKSLKSGKTV